MKERIERLLPSSCTWKVQWYDSITSTNDVLKTMASQGAPEGTVLIAGHQTGGRGRRGRSFLSPPDVGIYLSALIRPNCKPEQLMHLTCAVAEAMCDAVAESAGFRPRIKWTNDLVSGKRKLSGILTELGFSPDGRVSYAVIGIGINCCQQPQDFPREIQDIAGSLAMVSGKEIDRARVAAAMTEALEAMNRKLLTDKTAILNAYRRDCMTIGQAISVVRGDEVRRGTALDVDEDGALIVRYDDGETAAVNSGEVSVRGMYGYV